MLTSSANKKEASHSDEASPFNFFLWAALHNADAGAAQDSVSLQAAHFKANYVTNL